MLSLSSFSFWLTNRTQRYAVPKVHKPPRYKTLSKVTSELATKHYFNTKDGPYSLEGNATF